MKKPIYIVILVVTLLSACISERNKLSSKSDFIEINKTVFNIENAFAQTMIDRDFKAFSGFIADDAVFFSGDKPVRGKEAVLQAWEKFYHGQDVPFTWQADVVEAHPSGTLVLSNGPVYNIKGEIIARFNSIWQKQKDGRWQVIFDKGTTKADFK